MNAHLIRIVEGPLPGDALAANDAVFDLPPARTRDTSLTLVSAIDARVDKPNAIPYASAEDEYYLGGYAAT